MHLCDRVSRDMRARVRPAYYCNQIAMEYGARHRDLAGFESAENPLDTLNYSRHCTAAERSLLFGILAVLSFTRKLPGTDSELRSLLG